MKRAQMISDKRNIRAVVVRSLGNVLSYTLYYTSGTKRQFKRPSADFRARFDWWFTRLDTDNVPRYSSIERIIVLTPSYSCVIPDSVRFDVPAFDDLESEGFVL